MAKLGDFFTVKLATGDERLAVVINPGEKASECFVWLLSSDDQLYDDSGDLTSTPRLQIDNRLIHAPQPEPAPEPPEPKSKK